MLDYAPTAFKIRSCILLAFKIPTPLFSTLRYWTIHTIDPLTLCSLKLTE